MFASLKRRFLDSDFCRVYNFRSEKSKGSTMLLIHSMLWNFGNPLITGVFYTAFLAQNGIDIVKVGIISFIPYLSWCFSLVSPMFLRKFKRRRALLLGNHMFYYICVVLATTIMPYFVADPFMRTVWFAVFLFIGNVANAIIGPGTMAWHIHFIPEENNDRNIYLSYQNLGSSIISTAVAITSAVVADALSGSPQEALFIEILRYAAFALFVVDGLLLFLVPKEYEYTYSGSSFGFRDIFTLPFKQKKFLYCALVCFFWNFIALTNGSTWSYFLINTVEMPYLMTLITSIACVLGNMFLLRYWRRLISRFSWHRMLMVCFLLEAMQELFFSFTSRDTHWVFIATSVYAGLIAVGLNLTYANLFYINLPKGDRDVYHVFWNLGANIMAFLGASFGTWLINLFIEIEPIRLFGVDFYGSQFLLWVRFILTILLALFIWKITPLTQPDPDSGY